jgi:CRISPR system Cascade subunit CasE
MSYLTQIHIGKAEAARLRLADPYAWHQRLWLAFPGRDGAPRSFLFRVDDKHATFRVLMLSHIAPIQQGWGAWEVKSIGDSFLAHSRYLFQVRANPTIKRAVFNDRGEFKKNGRRTAIYDAGDLRGWIDRKARQSGFELIECTAGPAIQSYFVKDGRRGKHVAVDFQGVLSVTDPPVFEKVFHNGIGPARAFGFGLLMLQPVA